MLEFFVDNTLIKAIVMILVGILALRMAGRKSLSQMTISQAVIMIAIGSILVEPVKEDDVFLTILTILLFVLVLYLLEILSMRYKVFEKFIVGHSKVVVLDGKIVDTNLKTLRLTVNQLEMILRQNKIGNISEVKIATLEANGQFGYELIDDVKPMTVSEFRELTGNFFDDYQKANQEMQKIFSSNDLFEQVKQNDDIESDKYFE